MYLPKKAFLWHESKLPCEKHIHFEYLDSYLPQYQSKFWEPTWLTFTYECWIETSFCWRKRATAFNPVWHDVGKQEKCSSLEPPRGNFYKTQWAGQGVKITSSIYVNFHLQKSFFEKKSADKIDPTRTTLKDNMNLHVLEQPY